MKNNSTVNKWCCSGLAKAFSERNKCTVFVYSEKPEEEFAISPLFWLAMRSIKRKEYDEIESPQKHLFTTSAKKAIHFCPWCGINLSSIYPSYPNALTDTDIEEEFNDMN